MATQVAALAPVEWLSIGEAAVFANISAGTIYRKIREDKLKAFDRMGRTVLRRSDLCTFMEPVPLSRAKKRARR
jgi:excisionase family DNA binding protein